MSCAFDLAHYREIVEAAQAGGYRFAHFDGAPATGSVILRHDVDLSLDAAVRMAELENDAGAAATYFLMTESVFYNLDSSEGVAAIARLRELGHRVAQHAVYPNAPLDERFDPVVAWHNPDPEYMRAPLPDGRINVMQDPWFDPATYRSDSNQHWRSGCPHDDLRAGAFPWLQLLTHPEIWAYPGETMGADDARDARGREGAAAAAARGRPHRPDVSEPLDGGDRARTRWRSSAATSTSATSVVVRVGDTVRRPVGPHTDAVHALLRHFETVGFDGAPRALGVDERGREVLSFVEGAPGARAVPTGRRRPARAGRAAAADARGPGRLRAPPDGTSGTPARSQPPAGGEVICHNDLFPPNVIFRDGSPVALIDWDLCAPAPPLYDIASAANFWVPLRPRRRARAFGSRRPSDGASGCASSATATASTRPTGASCSTSSPVETGWATRSTGSTAASSGCPAGARCGTRGSGDEILERSAWFEAHRADLQRSLA